MVTRFSRCRRFSITRVLFALLAISFAALSSPGVEINSRNDFLVVPLDSQLWLREFGTRFTRNSSATGESTAVDLPSGSADGANRASIGKKKQKQAVGSTTAAGDAEKNADEKKLSGQAVRASAEPAAIDPFERMESQLLLPSVTLTSAAMSGDGSESKDDSASSGVSPSDWDASVAHSARRDDHSTVKGPSLTTYLVAMAALIVVCGAFLTPKH
jgi:hypothetical protein